MKKILISLAMIAVVSAASVGATKAYFTSDVVYSQNTFATGTLVLTDSRESWMLPFSISNMKPGDFIRRWVTFRNEGSLDIDYLTVDKNVTSDPDSLLGQINVSTQCAIDGVGANMAFFTDDWGVKPTVSSWFTNSDMLDGPAYYRTAAGIIHPTESYVCVMDFTMPTTVGNDFQGKSATFDLTFTGEQSH